MDMAAELTPGSTELAVVSAVGPPAQRSMPAVFVRRWNQALRTWARERIRGMCGFTASFEDVLHEFSAIIETEDNPAMVEAALLRQARRIVTACRVELITGLTPTVDRGNHIQSEGAGPASDESPLCPGADRSGRSLEVPLCCGKAVRGRLRIRSRARGITSLTKKTIRQLTTLCTVGASALDSLYRQKEWPWDDDVAHLDDPPGADPARSASRTEVNFPQTALLHDATFLNAVLPFALNQARRHREPLSLVCVSIDRLGGIRKLLGHAAVDGLVRKVAETVASLIRTSDIVARLDDDRVVAVLPRAPGGGALDVAQKICRAVMQKTSAGCEPPNVTVSIGVATFPSCADNVFSLFDAADGALARAQSQGRNQAALAPPRPLPAPSPAHAVSSSS